MNDERFEALRDLAANLGLDQLETYNDRESLGNAIAYVMDNPDEHERLAYIRELRGRYAR